MPVRAHAGWLVISLVLEKDPLLDYTVVALMLLGAIFLMVSASARTWHAAFVIDAPRDAVPAATGS